MTYSLYDSLDTFGPPSLPNSWTYKFNENFKDVWSNVQFTSSVVQFGTINGTQSYDFPLKFGTQNYELARWNNITKEYEAELLPIGFDGWNSQFFIGRDDAIVSKLFIGPTQSASPVSVGLSSPDRTGTNSNSGSLTIVTGKSTGNGQGGSIIFGISSPTASGTTVNPPVNKMWITPTDIRSFQGRIENVTVITSSTYTPLATDYIIAVDTTVSGCTISLPSSSTTGKTIIIKDIGGNANTNNIIIDSTTTIDGLTSITLNNNYAGVTLFYAQSKWNLL